LSVTYESGRFIEKKELISVCFQDITEQTF
jgi:hypothetical protein